MKNPKTLAYSLMGAAGVMYLNLEVGSALAVLAMSVAVARSIRTEHNDEQHQQDFKAANDSQLEVFITIGVPEEIARASLPADTAWEHLFGKPMGDIDPILTWLKNNKPQVFANLNPQLRSRAK